MDSQQEGWWYDYDDLPMMDESATTLNVHRAVSKESLPIWERDTTGNIILRRLLKKRQQPKHLNTNDNNRTSSPVKEKSPTKETAQKHDGDHFIMNGKSRPNRSVSIRSEDTTLGVLREEEDVFIEDKKAALASVEESLIESEAEGYDLTEDMISLSISDDAIHSNEGKYSSSTEDGMLPLELQDEIDALNELTRQVENTEQDHQERINNISLYEELYESESDDEIEGNSPKRSMSKEPLVQEEHLENELESDSEIPLMLEKGQLQINSIDEDIDDEEADLVSNKKMLPAYLKRFRMSENIEAMFLRADVMLVRVNVVVTCCTWASWKVFVQY